VTDGGAVETRRVAHASPVHVEHRVNLGRWPLVGRDDELELAAAELATRGCVVLTGAAGVGKTRLAHEVLARVATEGDRPEWVTATQSAAAVPLGAVAHLVPEGVIGRGRAATLRGIVAALRRAESRRLLLGVDDAHLLDDASAALVQLLVAGGTVSAIVTVRSGEDVPDSIVSLWKDGPAPLVVLQALARAEVETIVATVLEDPVDGATLHFLWESSRGNALFLRELVHHGVESGMLRCEQGLWRWRGRLQPGERLQTLVAMRIGTLSDAEQAALELVAVGQPLSVDCLCRLGVTDLVTLLERRGLVASQRRQSGVLALAHPLFGEVLRDRIPPARRNEVQLELADALEATGDGSSADQARIAVWRVDAGDYSRPEQIRAAAGRALRLWEPAVAERLARAALDSGPEIEAALLLGAALSDQNRADEALAAFRLARSLPGPDRLRASAATSEAGVLSHQLGRLPDAEQILRDTLEQVTDAHARATLEGGRAAIVVSGGFPMSGTPGTHTSAVPTAALAALIENATAGQLDRAVLIATDQLATASEWTAEFPTIELYLHLAQTWALTLSGGLSDAQARADAAYAAAVEEHAAFPRLTWSFVRGMIFVARGLPHSATRALREAAAGFEVADRGFLRPTHTYLAMAAALAGDAATSERHLWAAYDAKPSFEALFAVDLARAGGWLSAARGEVSTAADEAQRAADVARSRSVPCTTLHASAAPSRSSIASKR
jgi:tetratricopeptide (TPR) repeat protein